MRDACIQQSASAEAESRFRAYGWLIPALWIAAGISLFLALGRHPVTRTQEARVLVTAREMVGAPLQRWLIPHTNGQTRLRKPPLAYWLTAGSFSAFGVNETSGRAPAALAAWLTVGITYCAGRFIFGAIAGFVAAAALLSCVGFYHYGRLAETDIFVTLFVTGAIYSTYRGFVVTRGVQDLRAADDDADHAAGCAMRCAAPWYHVAALGTALALLTKGPPAAYPLLFLGALCVTERRWTALRQWVLCGAPITLVLVGSPWFAYILGHPEWKQAGDDLRNSALGSRGHAGWFLKYIPQLLFAVLPWSGVLLLALCAAAHRLRRAIGLRPVFVWIAVVVIPLCLWGNKQPHYLLPLLPAVMMLVGWLSNDFARPWSDPRTLRWLRGILAATTASLLVAALGAPIAGHLLRGRSQPIDAALPVVVLGVVVFARLGQRRFGEQIGVAILAVGLGVLCAPVLACFQATLSEPNPRTIARSLVADFSSGPYVFWRGGINLPLVFYLGDGVPQLTTRTELHRFLEREPGGVVLQAIADDVPADPPPCVLPVPVQRHVTAGRTLLAFTSPAASTRPSSQETAEKESVGECRRTSPPILLTRWPRIWHCNCPPAH
jgi:4-amino-4-deoxy-L-arabinose transferase-like glycosyltransferase